MTGQHYFTRIIGKIHGPYTGEEMCKMATRGVLGRMHEVSQDRRNWRCAEEFPEFFAVVTPDIQSRVVSGADSDLPYATPCEVESDYRLEPAADPVNRGTHDGLEAEYFQDGPGAGTAVPGQDLYEQQPWYYDRGNEQTGPVPYSTVRVMISAGELTPHDMVWTDGMATWTSIGDLPSLFPEAASRPANPTSARSARGSKTASYDPASTTNESYSPLAIASLVCALLPLFGISSFAAILLGAFALNQIGASTGRIRGSGMAIAGITIGTISLFFWIIWGLSQTGL